MHMCDYPICTFPEQPSTLFSTENSSSQTQQTPTSVPQTSDYNPGMEYIYISSYICNGMSLPLHLISNNICLSSLFIVLALIITRVSYLLSPTFPTDLLLSPSGTNLHTHNCPNHKFCGCGLYNISFN